LGSERRRTGFSLEHRTPYDSVEFTPALSNKYKKSSSVMGDSQVYKSPSFCVALLTNVLMVYREAVTVT
jgi:hypothetical protein